MGRRSKASTSSLCIILSIVCSIAVSSSSSEDEYVSAIGDPYMKRDGLRLAIESWNQCNEVGEETPHMGSPRVADCFDVYKATNQGKSNKCSLCNSMPYMLVHRVTEEDNKLGVGQPFEGVTEKALKNADLYAAEKELYLGNKCQVEDSPAPWQFWTVMLKSGNMDTLAAKCPKNGQKPDPFPPDGQFPCFGKGCMNQPSIYHNYTSFEEANGSRLAGRFYGSWDVTADPSNGSPGKDVSFHSVAWEKDLGQGSWVFHHVLRTSSKYPWLMLYLRADATRGFSGGYHYPTRGMLKSIPQSPKFNVTFTLNVIKGGGPSSQFYLMDIGSCWKNDGNPCDGDVTSDVTRYSEMIINPQTQSWCKAKDIKLCPPYHTFPDGTRVHRNDTSRFPYDAYHLYCGPGNARDLEKPNVFCDPYSNPQPQEILQILPHPVWGNYGYPTKKGDGWVGDKRTWNLDVGGLSQSLYFYQDPGTDPVKRKWMSVDLGTEIYKDANQEAEWTVSDFNILVPKK